MSRQLLTFLQYVPPLLLYETAADMNPSSTVLAKCDDVADLGSKQLAPMGAGAQASAQGWRWSYRTLGIVLALAFVLFLFFFEESKYTSIIRGVDASSASDPDELVRKPSRKQDQQGIIDIVPLTLAPTTTDHEIDSSIPMWSWRQRLAFYTYTRETL